jgi:hypothetical protein
LKRKRQCAALRELPLDAAIAEFADEARADDRDGERERALWSWRLDGGIA